MVTSCKTIEQCRTQDIDIDAKYRTSPLLQRPLVSPFIAASTTFPYALTWKAVTTHLFSGCIILSSRMLYKWNHMVCNMSPLWIISRGSYRSLCAQVAHSLLWLRIIPWCERTTFPWTVHPMNDTWVTSMLAIIDRGVHFCMLVHFSRMNAQESN